MKSGAFRASRWRRLAAAVALTAVFVVDGCGDACVGYSSYTDANGLIVFVGCDGVAFVVTPTPGSSG